MCLRTTKMSNYVVYDVANDNNMIILMLYYQLAKSDWQAMSNPKKDDWKSSTMVVGEESVMTTSITQMLQSPVINWDLGKTNIHYH